jgi:hypothetical protein
MIVNNQIATLPCHLVLQRSQYLAADSFSTLPPHSVALMATSTVFPGFLVGTIPNYLRTWTILTKLTPSCVRTATETAATLPIVRAVCSLTTAPRKP